MKNRISAGSSLTKILCLLSTVYQSPVRAYGGFCLQPERPARCDVADNTRLVYYKADKCDEKFMYFTHKDGVLIHSCSGKRVCPRGENRESILRLKETRRKNRLFLHCFKCLICHRWKGRLGNTIGGIEYMSCKRIQIPKVKGSV